MTLRPLRPDEVLLAENIIEASLLLLDVSPTPDDKAVLRALPGSFTNRGGAFWLLEVNGGAAGTVGTRPLADASGLWELAWLCLSPGRRGMGIGRMMAETAIETARARGALGIIAQWDPRCAAAIALLTRLGFHVEHAEVAGGRDVTRLRRDFVSA